MVSAEGGWSQRWRGGRSKEVINVKDGAASALCATWRWTPRQPCLTAVVVYGKLRLFGLLGREADFVIPWGDIVLIGEDTVLVSLAPKPAPGDIQQAAGKNRLTGKALFLNREPLVFRQKSLASPGACAIIFQQNTRRAFRYGAWRAPVCPLKRPGGGKAREKI